MRRALVTAFAALLADGAAAQQIPCGGFHAVRQGDTLQRIAVRAYGPEASWRTLWAANRDRLGGDPSLIEIGDLIFIPCLDA
jgi:polar amino acid transport system substrate-binding protein